MSNYNIGLSADSKTAYVTVRGDALPAEATNVLTDFKHGLDGSGDPEATDKVHDNADNHVLYHDVQDALYRQEGIQDMQSITIIKRGILGAESISADGFEVFVGATDTIDIEYLPEEDDGVNADFVFVSGDTNLATVNASGVVTGVAYGEVTITATHKDTAQIVEVPVTVVQFTGAAISLAALATAPSVIKLQPADTVVLASEFTYVSSVPGKATVHASTGLITGVAAGSTVITATHTATGKTATIAVTVTA